MDIFIKSSIPYPIQSVYEAMRDHMPKLVLYMPNIQQIIVEKREQKGNVLFLQNRWIPAQTEIPAVARSFIDSNNTYWIDHAQWEDNAQSCSWRLEMGFMTERVTCTGTTAFAELRSDQTEMIIKGTLTLNLKGLVPRLLLGRATKGIEGFVGKMVEPNFRKTTEALTAYLSSQNQSKSRLD
jgi:hypothetical protein